ncbi:MAG: porin [Nitrospirae bacterium]|nr:porin [Nitrospirota bacterium]
MSNTIRLKSRRGLLFSCAMMMALCSWSNQAQAQALHSTPPPSKSQPVLMAATGGSATASSSGARSAGLSESQPSQLEDVLLEKGILSMDDWVRIKAESEARAAEQSSLQGVVANPHWYERMRMQGFVQTRMSFYDNGKGDLSLTDSKAVIAKGNGIGAVGGGQKMYFRRIRLPISGQPSERLFFFIQPAFEGDGYNTGNVVNLVDAFADYMITKDQTWRLRFGMQRALVSFDTLRTSSQRQELDRHESIQTSAPGERDMGIALFYTTPESKARYQTMTQYHNGPGDYGNIAFQMYNGQGRNAVDYNKDKHFAGKISYPFELPNGRLIDVGAHAYTGLWDATGVTSMTTGATRCSHSISTDGFCTIRDERLSAYVWTPPQPWGIMSEAVVGRGPERGSDGFLREASLYGGYIQGNYTWRYSDTGLVTPYVRYGEYYGGSKNSTSGANYDSKNVNAGLVWEPDTHWRFVAEYLFKHGTNAASSAADESALTFGQSQQVFNMQMLRLQAQWLWN